MNRNLKTAVLLTGVGRPYLSGSSDIGPIDGQKGAAIVSG